MATKRTPLVQVYGLRETKPKSLAETLDRIREVLSDKKNWVKGELFTNAKGDSSVELEQAKRVCLLGACHLVDGRFQQHAIRRISEAIKKKHGGEFVGLESFNDDDVTRHQHVLDVLDLAIGAYK